MTQDDRIIAYLKAGSSLTGLEALNLFGTMKLATRISEIKRKNPTLDIRDEYVHKNGKSFKRYWIKRPQFDGDMFLSEDGVRQHEWSKK
jgi:hypothetical protein